jgi:hypothetical protein
VDWGLRRTAGKKTGRPVNVKGKDLTPEILYSTRRPPSVRRNSATTNAAFSAAMNANFTRSLWRRRPSLYCPREKHSFLLGWRSLSTPSCYLPLLCGTVTPTVPVELFPKSSVHVTAMV